MPDDPARMIARSARRIADPAERDAYLQRVCRGGGRLRAEVDRILAEWEGSGEPPTTPAPAPLEVVAPVGPATRPDPAAVGIDTGTEKAGDTIGRYLLVKELGAGGFGTVWLAEQREPVRRQVALKIIKLGMDTAQVVVRFEQERQALALMDHPNVARVLDAGATSAGRPYFVMDLVQGVPLQEHCDEARMTVEERLELFGDVCAAVQHAHMKGIIHRDLKPSNVLVGMRDGKPHATVIDFGIAKATSTKLTDRSLVTEAYQVIGTLQYMSPEQSMASPDIDTRTDVYSLGVILYELVAGRPPYDEAVFQTGDFSRILAMIAHEDPPPPSSRILATKDVAIATTRSVDLRRLASQVRGELDWIVMRAIEKDRERRYESAEALAGDIRRYLTGEPIVAAPPSTTYRLRKFVRRHRGKVIACCAVLLVLVLGIAGTGWGLLWALDEKRRADDEATRAGISAAAEKVARVAAQDAAEKARIAKAEAETRARELAQVAEFQSDQLGGLDAEQMGAQLRRDLLDEVHVQAERAALDPDAARARVAAVEKLIAGVDFTGMAVRSLETNVFQRALDAITTRFGDQPLVRARLDQTLATILHHQGLFKLAEGPQTDALEIRRRELGEDAPDTIASLCAMSRLLISLARFDAAERAARDALERSRRVLGPEDAQTLECMGSLGVALGNMSRDEESKRLNREGLEIARRALGPDDARTTTWMIAVTAGLSGDGDYAAAKRMCLDVLDIEHRNGRDDGPMMQSAISWLVVVEQRLENFDAAERYARQYLDWSRRVLGDDHRNTLLCVNNLGWLLRSAGRYDEAERCLRQAYEGRLRVLGEDHQHTLVSLRNLAAVEIQRGRPKEAESCARRAADGLRRTQGDDNMDTLWALHVLGQALLAEGRTDEAVAPLREAADGYARLYGAGSGYTLVPAADLSRALVALCRNDEALARWRTTLDAAPDDNVGRKVLEFVDSVITQEGFAEREDAWLYLDTRAAAASARADPGAAADAERRALQLLPPGRPERADCERRLREYEAAANKR